MAHRRPEGITTLYLICCLMRTGSSLLHFMLRDAGLGNAREYLHGNQPVFDNYADYARRIYNGNRRRDVMGWRVMWGHLWGQQQRLPAVWEPVAEETMLDGIIEAVGADTVRFIYIKRRDYLRQAVSFVRAQTLQRWYCPADQTDPEIDIPFTQENRERVYFLVREFPSYEEKWELYFRDRAIEPLRFVYEDVTASDATIRDGFWQMVDYIGADLPEEYEVNIPIRKQAGQDVERWIKQYKVYGNGCCG